MEVRKVTSYKLTLKVKHIAAAMINKAMQNMTKMAGRARMV